MQTLFRNIRLALISAKCYTDLCDIVGFLDRFLGMETFEIVTEIQSRREFEVVTPELMRKEGERLIWQQLGGVPPEGVDITSLKVRACQGKGYHVTPLEEVNESSVIDKTFGNDDQVPTPFDGDENAILGELNLVRGSSKGVLIYRFGLINVYVVSRDPLRSRYRVYIPSLSILPGSLGGFQCFPELNAETIRNIGYCRGLSKEYLRKQWFPNLAMICPILLGRVPEDHKTAVELSFKVKKHHTDLGVQARRRSGHMQMAEYVQRACEELKIESRRTIATLADMYRRGKGKEKSKMDQVGNRKSKKMKFSDIVAETNPLDINKRLKPGVFVRKELTQIPLPPSQQSQQDVVQSEETWAKKTAGMASEESDKLMFKKILQESKQRFFFGWSQSKIALFLTQHALSAKGLKLDKSHISRSLKDGPFPGKVIRVEIERFCRDVLPKLTVDFNHAKKEFTLLPGAVETLEKLKEELRIEEYARNPQLTDADNALVLVSNSDSVVKREDMRRVMRPINWSSAGLCQDAASQKRFWISDECINYMTTLFSSVLRESDKLFYFNSLTVSLLYECHYGEGSVKNVELEARTERAINILKRMTDIGRSGQRFQLSEAERLFVPCQLGHGSHWTSLVISRPTKEIISFDSMRKKDHKGNSASYRHAMLFKQVMQWLSGLEGTSNCAGTEETDSYKYIGDDVTFPQQTNNMDCGIFTILSGRKAGMGHAFSDEELHQGNLDLWRYRIAHEIVVKHAH